MKATVFVDEILHDDLLELLAYIGYVVLDAQAFGQSAGFEDEVRFFLSGCRELRCHIPSAHRYTHYFISLLLKHDASGGAVDAPAHAYQYSFLFLIFHSDKDKNFKAFFKNVSAILKNISIF